MHLLLVVGLTVLAFVIVDAGYFAGQLGHPAGMAQYVRLGWFAASVGTMTGALGSNFDSEESGEKPHSVNGGTSVESSSKTTTVEAVSPSRGGPRAMARARRLCARN